MSDDTSRLSRAWDALDMGPAWLVRGPAGAPADKTAGDSVDEQATLVATDDVVPPSQAESVPAPTEVTSVPASAPQTDWVPVEQMDWSSLREAVRSCTQCGLSETRRQTVFGAGDNQPRWLIVGEAPGANEDREGEPFVGEAGQLLDAMLRSVGVSRERGVFIVNVLKCRPPGNRDPAPDEVATCNAYLQRQVALLRPAMIFSMGRFASQALLGTEQSIGALRQKVHEVTVGDSNIPLVVGYHPAYLLRRPEEKIKAWQDICLARSICDPAAQHDAQNETGSNAD
jgi:DNA polymerase